MLSGNIREGGMIDGQLRRVVMFPDDGHPELAFLFATSRGMRATRSSCGIRNGSGFTPRIGLSPGRKSMRRFAIPFTTSQTTARQFRECQPGSNKVCCTGV